MSKIEVDYIEKHDSEGEGGHQAELEMVEETFHGEHIPRIGENIHIGGRTRVVLDVTYYSDTVVLYALEEDDYDHVNARLKRRMEEHNVVPRDRRSTEEE